MFRITSIICTLAVAWALLGTAACSKDEDIANEMCTYYQQCDPVEFANDFASMDDCRAEANGMLTQLQQVYGSACYGAAAAYYSCASKLSCTADPEVACAIEGARAEQECQVAVTNPCPGYVAGTDSDECCQTHDPCDWAGDQVCDCNGTCSWDSSDCAALPN